MANGSRSDSYFLSTDATFQHRVQSSVVSACIAISNEGWAVAFHRERTNFVAQVLAAMNGANSWTPIFAIGVATDSNCLSDATAAGTVVLTSNNVAAQAALVTDVHIDTAVASQFNSYIREPQN